MTILQRVRKVKQDVQVVRFLKPAIKHQTRLKSTIKKNADAITAGDWLEVKRLSKLLYCDSVTAINKIPNIKVPESFEPIKTTFLQALDEIRIASLRGIQAADERIEGNPAITATMASINHMKEYARLMETAVILMNNFKDAKRAN